LFIQPAVVDGGLEHGVFARHVVGEGGHAELLFDAVNNVQIRQAGFDHDHVSAFGQVEGDFAQGFVAVGGRHLVGALVGVAEVGGGTDGVAKRVVQAGRVLGGVGHDHRVDVAALLQRIAHGADAAVHHVRGRDD